MKTNEEECSLSQQGALDTQLDCGGPDPEREKHCICFQVLK